MRSPTNDAAANDAFRSPGLRQFEDSIGSVRRHIASAERGSPSTNARIRFSVTILRYPHSHNGNLMSRETWQPVLRPERRVDDSSTQTVAGERHHLAEQVLEIGVSCQFDVPRHRRNLL